MAVRKLSQKFAQRQIIGAEVICLLSLADLRRILSVQTIPVYLLPVGKGIFAGELGVHFVERPCPGKRAVIAWRRGCPEEQKPRG
ncbi:hypothetical protein SDC9_58590 [bioreactor metagenome]|uniref:Uncharacterized protein n=1 Tax=bioreactor metagenome TaxID=1076179 RepID=A0A644X8S7_9ZZZZ